MNEDPAEALAECLREWCAECACDYSDDGPCARCAGYSAALAAFDAARPVREAEGRVLHAVAAWHSGKFGMVDNLNTAYLALLAARGKKP